MTAAKSPSTNAMPGILALERTEFAGDTLWHVHLDGGHRVCVTTEELRSNKKFLCNCIEQLGRAFESTPSKRWAATINLALNATKEG